MSKIIIWLISILLSLCAIDSAAQTPYHNEYCFGLDLSFVKSAEEKGHTYYDIDGKEASPWEIFRNHGFNWGRLMICTEPSYLGQGIDYVIKGAGELKSRGYHFVLDYMLTDGWSNPMSQNVPKEWQGLSALGLEKKTYDFVHSTLTRLKEEGTMPEIVQIGNEVSNGILWPSGRVFYGEEKKDRSSWKQFTAYLKAGIEAVHDVDESVKVMLHVDFGGDRLFSKIFFSKMEEYGVDFDIIGFSFYPWSHGSLMDLRSNLAWVVKEFKKPVIVIETGYYSVPSQYFELSGEKGPFPETPQGQEEWFTAVNEIVMSVPDNMGLGTFWWEPMFRQRGFFDDETGIAKPVVEAVEKYALPLERTDGNPRIWDFEDEKH